MSFLHITDRLKRSQMVNEFLKTKRNIQLSNLSERLGDIEMKREFSKVFAPITESQQKTTEATEKGFAETQKALTIMPKQLVITTETPAITQSEKITLGPLATEYLGNYLNKKHTGDQMFGIRQENNKFYIGSKEVKIDNGDIIIGEHVIPGTRGLWELLTHKYPENYTDNDKNKYKIILIKTDGFNYPDYDPSQKPKGVHNSHKWKNIVKALYEDSLAKYSEDIPTQEEYLKKFGLLSESKKSRKHQCKGYS